MGRSLGCAAAAVATKMAENSTRANIADVTMAELEAPLWDASAPLETLSVEELKVLQAKLQVIRRTVARQLDALQVQPSRGSCDDGRNIWRSCDDVVTLLCAVGGNEAVRRGEAEEGRDSRRWSHRADVNNVSQCCIPVLAAFPVNMFLCNCAYCK